MALQYIERNAYLLHLEKLLLGRHLPHAIHRFLLLLPGFIVNKPNCIFIRKIYFKWDIRNCSVCFVKGCVQMIVKSFKHESIYIYKVGLLVV
jgi:hypothetical protein